MRCRLMIATISVIFVAGCAENPSVRIAPSVPEDAIQVGDQLYMIPLGVDQTGCESYQPYSPTLAVVQAIHYRRDDGSFTMVREECAPIKNDDGSAPPQ